MPTKSSLRPSTTSTYTHILINQKNILTAAFFRVNANACCNNINLRVYSLLVGLELFGLFIYGDIVIWRDSYARAPIQPPEASRIYIWTYMCVFWYTVCRMKDYCRISNLDECEQKVFFTSVLDREFWNAATNEKWLSFFKKKVLRYLKRF